MPRTNSLVNPQLFLRTSTGQWQCQVCPGRAPEPYSRALAHEDSVAHVRAVRTFDQLPPSSPGIFASPSPEPLFDVASSEFEATPSPPHSPPRAQQSPLRAQYNRSPSPDLLQSQQYIIHGPALPEDSEDQIYDDWGGELALNRPDNEPTNDFSDDDEPQEPPSDGLISNLASEPDMFGYNENLQEIQEEQAPDNIPIPEDNDDWWPWRQKEECLLDIMGAFPRSLFSEMELRAMRWYARKNGVPEPPTVKNVKSQRENIVNIAGIDSIMEDGKLGHLYTVNDWEKIIKHEFANPLIRPHLHFYPEDSGLRLEEARQAKRWREEVDGNLSAPMARTDDNKDYFVEEPCLATIDSLGTIAPVMPMKWFQRNGHIWANVHRLRLTRDAQHFIVDGTADGAFVLPLQAFFLSVIDLQDDHIRRRYALPKPESIAGILRTEDAGLEPWDRPAINPWRTLAAGKRVYSLPLWMYCDDTSGNSSKKWNKHNSILFTLSGLPRQHVQMLYNIHFIATSNIAPPLEMMESVVNTLRNARTHGIEVWDCVHQEFVLVIPWVLAFQGDNPMASEFASHIGMSGKCFCRVCHVRGADEKNRAPGDAGEIEQLSDFLKAGTPRTKAETKSDLDLQLERIVNGAPSSVDSMATETGSKDKYFSYFVDKLSAECAKIKEEHKSAPPLGRTKAQDLQIRLREIRNELPENLFNPVLDIPDFDPNSDSPVEILHVVLLGVVKYWWRDAVSRQQSAGKAELKTRLSSLDVSGLDIPRLRGHTLVQYAGSLVGRDFRVILQVAPAVLQGLIPDSHYEAWLALCRLAPLIFQPVIDDLPSYLEKLEGAVDDFLAATALWTTQWFNKPKFHLFLHLIRHIRRFGPAILYATESFESYNFVIRLRSIHSSRHAPSLDIAKSFAHLHAVRHLVSGGFVLQDADAKPIWPPRQAGQGILELIKDKEFLEFMCMNGLYKQYNTGNYTTLREHPLIAWDDTMAHKAGVGMLVESIHTQVLSCQSLILSNGDRATRGKYVLYRYAGDIIGLRAGRVEEILVESGSRRLLGLLLTQCRVGDPMLPYYFPSCSLLPDQMVFVAFEELQCAINTIHNCAAHKCAITKTRVVVQERLQTEHREDEYTHSTHPDDVLLNLAQLRNAHDVQKFQPPSRYPNLPRVDMIEQAVKNRKIWDAQIQPKKKAQGEKGKGKKKRAAVDESESTAGPSKRARTLHTTTQGLPPAMPPFASDIPQRQSGPSYPYPAHLYPQALGTVGAPTSYYSRFAQFLPPRIGPTDSSMSIAGHGGTNLFSSQMPNNASFYTSAPLLQVPYSQHNPPHGIIPSMNSYGHAAPQFDSAEGQGTGQQYENDADESFGEDGDA